MNTGINLTRRLATSTATATALPIPSHTTNATALSTISNAINHPFQLHNANPTPQKKTDDRIPSYTPLATDSAISSEHTTRSYTIDDAISTLGVGYFQYRLLFLTGMIAAADAMEMMLLSFLLPKLKADWELSPPWDGTIGAIAFVGQLLGTSSGAILSDKYGRKYVTISSTVGCAICGTISAFSYNLTMMLIMRFSVGFFVGFSCASYTLFAEYCPTHNRGRLLVIEQSFWAFGALFSVVLAWICLSDDWFPNHANNWRYYLFCCSVPLWIIALFYKMVPESPRWYLACNNTQMAQKMLETVSRVNGKALPKGKLAHHHGTCNPVSRGRISDIFCVEQYQYTSILLYITFWCCVFGYYGISFLSERYFELFGLGNVYWEMIITTSAEIPSLLFGLVLLDRFGRKWSMSLNFAIFFVCCAWLTMNGDIGYYGLGAVFLARMSISVSFMSLFIYFSEYYPTVIRSSALGCASACGRFAGIATSFISQDLSIKVALALYALGGFVAFVCSNLLPQDTLGRDLTNTVQSQINLLEHKVKLEDDDETDSDYLAGN